MAEVETYDVWAEAYSRNVGPFLALARRYREDAGYRRRVQADPIAAFREQGIEWPAGGVALDGVEVRVVANTDDRLYVVLPSEPNWDLSDETLAAVAGGETVASAGSVGTAGSIACSTAFGSFGTIGTAGTASSAAPR